MSNRRTMGRAVLAVVLPLVLFGCNTSAEPETPTPEGPKKPEANAPVGPWKGPTYDAKGELKRPADHRKWIFVGAPVTPNDMNGGKAAFPEFHNVYIDPVSFAEYEKTGKFPNGTTILKELVTVGGKAMASGKGYFQGEFLSLEAMVKDTKRFDREPGGWAFFRFGEAPNYKPTGKRMETVSCNSCHSAATEDYVFTATYPVLRAAKPKK